MRTKEIDKIVFEQLGSFLNGKGFKIIKKRRGFSKTINNITFNIGFTYLDRRPEYYYSFVLGIFIQEVGDIKSKSVEGREKYIGKFSSYTYILPFPYFITPNKHIQKNSRWIIANEQDINVMVKEVKQFYNEHLDNFIENHSNLDRIYKVFDNLIENDIVYGLAEPYDVFARSLIILKLLKSNNFENKLNEYKAILDKSPYEENRYIDMFNYIERL